MEQHMTFHARIGKIKNMAFAVIDAMIIPRWCQTITVQ